MASYLQNPFHAQEGTPLPLLTNFLSTVKDGTAVRAAIPLVGIATEEKVYCFYTKGELPNFILSFPDSTFSAEQVDSSRSCLVHFEFTNQTVSITATIHSVVSNSALELTAKATVTHAHARNYFRVDAATPIAASSVAQEAVVSEEESWRLLGDTIDLSGSGVLCSFHEPLEPHTRARIELTLPARGTEVIIALGHVVRCRKIKEHFYHIALHFDVIDTESQDKIMACCFELQRRYLRMRVRLEGIESQAS
ncbi:PilZ domain-containing protein [Desulfobulbus oligotrophicus]|uniref:PilZ domain-containing protein n=1 Tax=Desulfobulbus oligotrophicus TaxID=1909699 RepID=A0A7T5VDL8_9BACT|nr:PilZ domain-containing protein [Desulfobulbus oligotrophicus]QQG65995.1 PilZ domain-containing protein [Desulfobulbus oligotrophicus]